MSGLRGEGPRDCRSIGTAIRGVVCFELYVLRSRIHRPHSAGAAIMIDAGPEIVLLPGLDGSGHLFSAIEKELSNFARVTVVRYPDDAGRAYFNYVDFVRAQIADRKVILLGESFSGPIAILTAVASPKTVSGLILSSTFQRPPWPGWLLRGLAKLNFRKLPRRLKNIGLLGIWLESEDSRAIWKIVDAVPPEVLSHRLVAVSRVDVREAYAELTCPILVLHGTRDMVVPPFGLRPFIKTSNDVQTSMFPGPHMLLQVQAKPVAARISNFIKSLGK